MTGAVAILGASAAFGAFAWAGVRAGEFASAGVTAAPDGPPPVAYRAGTFVVAGAVLGALSAAGSASLAHVAPIAFAVAVLAGCAAADLRCGMLPDVLILPALAVVVLAGLVLHDASPALGALLACAPFALLALLTRGYGMGWGDAKLAALGGAVLGAGGAALAFVIAAVAAYAVARASGTLRRPVAFGPYLAASIAATLAFVRMP